jgi:septation ring formation regulator EzrA
MNLRLSSFSRRVLAAATVSLGLFAAGCSSTGYRQAAATSTNLSTAVDDIEASQRQLNLATISLDRLLNQPTTDLRPGFRDFRSAVDGLDRSVGSLERRAQEMANRRVAYLRTWDIENAAIQDQAIRARSVARQQEVANQLLQVERSYLNARENFLPLISSLRDIERLLSVDLTVAGVENARSLFGQTERNAENARQALARLAQDFREVSVHLDPAGTVIAE